MTNHLPEKATLGEVINNKITPAITVLEFIREGRPVPKSNIETALNYLKLIPGILKDSGCYS